VQTQASECSDVVMGSGSDGGCRMSVPSYRDLQTLAQDFPQLTYGLSTMGDPVLSVAVVSADAYHVVLFSG